MIGPPPYFERTRLAAEQRWKQLEADPDLAGPWHQLFKQVQSPRHVLSELLQNADDAGATEAAAYIEDRCFVFTHNGEDFSDEHFTSLCRFGYSNKRALHTIGFRGIGFKSTFSLGDVVRLQTPTLSVAFKRQRFTEPQWIGAAPPAGKSTEIRVEICDSRREKEIHTNLHDWLSSPFSLLFFRHLRRLQIADRDICWRPLGPGPVSNTEWMALHDKLDDAYLVARSAPEAFPAEALDEIKQERLLSVEQDTDFPPCRVEIVLGATGRLYVVLPTGVETKLPFACNAPFIQDPARLKIKNPEMSPTNRWLLERTGALAASVMLQWLGQSSAELAERSRAYELLPDVDRNDHSLEGACATTVELACADVLEKQPFALTNDGELRLPGQVVILPDELFSIWRAEQVATLFDGRGRPALSRHVSNGNCDKLVAWNLVERVNKDSVITVLQSAHLPQPEHWSQLLKLWAYVAPKVTAWSPTPIGPTLRIVPVQGKSVLYATSEVVRLGEKRLLQSDADWEFLAAHLLVLNQNWPRFLTEQCRNLKEANDAALNNQVSAALNVLKSLGLEDSSDVSKVIERVAAGFFTNKSIPIADCVKLTQICAKLGATVGDSFRFVTSDLHLRSRDHVVLFDDKGALELLLPKTWYQEHVLHDAYSKVFASCTPDEWGRWISTGRGRLEQFVPLLQTSANIWRRNQIEAELVRRGYVGTPYYSYVTSSFIIQDWDFDEILWRHWSTLAKEDTGVWGRLLDCVVSQPESYWTKSKCAAVFQVATTGNTRSIASETLLPAWILKFRDLPCLMDNRGVYRKPTELLRRTPETESLMDVESFVHNLLDREATRPLLALLGVQDKPTGPDRLLNCLRALAQSDKSPVHEVEKWYRRLDQMVDTCSTTDLTSIKKSLHDEKLILTESAGWVTASGVFLSSDEEDVPGAAVVRASVRDLALWRKIGIAERPTADLAIHWLTQLPSGKPLSADDVRRVRALFVRYPVRIWEECGHWLNLAGEWVPTVGLSYALTLQSLIPWKHLHEWVRQKTADLQRLPAEVTAAAPFSSLATLAGQVEDRFHRDPRTIGQPETKSWLIAMGTGLCRIRLDDEDEAGRIRALAGALRHTSWQTTPGLEIIPYIDGTPAGTPRSADVLWLDRVVYVEKLSTAKLAKRVPEEIGKFFNRADIKAALDYGFERSPDDIRAYLEENFTLDLCVDDETEARDEAERETDLDASASTSDDASPNATDTAEADSEEPSPDDDQDAAHADQVAEEGLSDEPDDEEPNDTDNADDSKQRTRHPTTPAKPSLIERFARAKGFEKDGDQRFFHPDGSWIVKANGDRFSWERRTASGELVTHYWAKDHCIEREPLQIDFEVWGLFEKFPETYTLLLADSNDEAVELSGARLRAMRETGELTLYPATYRMVVNNDRQTLESNPRGYESSPELAKGTMTL